MPGFTGPTQFVRSVAEMRMRRRVRSWRHHTTSTEMARAFVGIGAALVLVCAILLGLGTHWL